MKIRRVDRVREVGDCTLRTVLLQGTTPVSSTTDSSGSLSVLLEASCFRETVRQASRRTDKQIDTQTVWQAGRQIDHRQARRQTDRQTDTPLVPLSCPARARRPAATLACVLYGTAAQISYEYESVSQSVITHIVPSMMGEYGVGRVRKSGFCWTIWIRFFYGCSGCAVYFVFSTFLLSQTL